MSWPEESHLPCDLTLINTLDVIPQVIRRILGRDFDLLEDDFEATSNGSYPMDDSEELDSPEEDSCSSARGAQEEADGISN